MSRAFLIAVLMLAAGCGSSRWDKPGTDAATEDRDLQACRQSARALVARDPALNRLVRPMTTDAGSLSTQSQDVEAERQLREFQETQRCMRDKGYQLKPAAAR